MKNSELQIENQEVVEAGKPRLPSWCPKCMEANAERFPYVISPSLVGCITCMSSWRREELERMVVTQDPRYKSRV